MTDETYRDSIDQMAGECLGRRMRMLNRAMTNLYDEALRPFGLKGSQLSIMLAAAKMGIARPADVCRHLHLDESTLSRNVERMRAKGWLKSVSDEDGRAQPFRMTPAGRRVLEAAMPAWKEAQQRAREFLGEQGVEWLNRVAARVGQEIAGSPTTRA
jgi:DNA-binding MarR family transcriptional regulator